ncbi:hypothetical protein CERSUDRAFT_123877 [Gelatoporia subvermispora B]|uniref:Uncharacterized protein n=1 Tax=Ceriporiopsis subvermispora (strain B) TaxID=914234 RepID=M2RDD3_CERS8|nr:hypothetical protein CERSUDRAFT_123877 [Gelatoporia subvermispora B]
MLSSDQIYATELLHLGQGLPLWDSEPASAGDEVYIGDVGHIYRGAFHRLFNAMSNPEDAKNNERLLPDPYSKLQLPRADACMSTSSYAGSQFELQCSTEQGAFLFLHSDAERSEVMPTRLMEQYMASNYKHWVHLAQERYKRKLDVDDIYFVRGFVKATGWTVGHFSKATSVTWSRQGLRTPEIRQGPRRGLSYDGTPELLIDGTEARPSSSAYQPSRNQCIFLHYYKIKERVLRAPKIIRAAAEPRDLPRDENGDVSPAAVIGSDDQESIDLEDDVPNKIYDPVDDILTYILENSAAALAISSDYEARILYEVYESEDLAGILGSASPAIVVDPLGCGSLAFVTTMPYLERGKFAERPELCTMIRSQIAQRTSAQWSDVTGLSSSAKAATHSVATCYFVAIYQTVAIRHSTTTCKPTTIENSPSIKSCTFTSINSCSNTSCSSTSIKFCTCPSIKSCTSTSIKSATKYNPQRCNLVK